MPKKRLGAGAYAVLGALPQAAGYVGLPLAVARSQRRHGWRAGRPGPLNLLGLIPLGLGAGMIGWAVASHYEQAPPDRSVTLVPDYLVATGAYGVSRNPLYVGGAAMWAGWTILLGGRRVGAVGLAWLSFVATVGVPFEERMLRGKFGAAYDDYVERVPRWV